MIICLPSKLKKAVAMIAPYNMDENGGPQTKLSTLNLIEIKSLHRVIKMLLHKVKS